MAKTILIAEDDQGYQFLIQLFLRENGFQGIIVTVGDGHELMDFLNNDGRLQGSPAPDLIILDLNMPHKHGKQALREIKTTNVLSLIPVVILSSSDSEIDMQFSRDLGCPFIQKPNNYIGWAKAIEEALAYIGTDELRSHSV